ncbi:uncharacterized protein [Eleutherodactylus coqui]|uniref:uncharacterized protein isoform X2 n=1 Tax=Eleutherodactylus coqui TaxID=57060 RepID=UPI0034633C40
MEDLLRQLVIRAESAGGEEWLRSCLTLPLPSVNTSASQLGVLEPEPEDPVINMGDVEQEALEGAEQDVLELSATVDPGLYAPEGEERPREMTSQKRQRKRTRAYTPPRRRSARRRAAQEGSQSRGGSLAGAVREQGAGEGTSNGPMRTIVWIVGHSFVFWAKQRAAERCYSELLGLNNELFVIYWAGRRGMRWGSLMSELIQKQAIWPVPDILIIHLGGNDVGKGSTLALLREMKLGLVRVRDRFPSSVLVFSEIIPRLLWTLPEFKYIERIRKRVNHAMAKFLGSVSGFSFRHTELEGFIAGLFRDDLVHLSDIGLDIFNADLQAMVEKAALSVGGPCHSL